MRGNDKVDKRSEVTSDHRRRSKFSLWASGGDLFFDVFMVVVSLPCQQPNGKILTVSRVTYQNLEKCRPSSYDHFCDAFVLCVQRFGGQTGQGSLNYLSVKLTKKN